MSRRRRPADVCRVLGRCASRQLSPGPRCFLLRLFGVGQQRVDGAAAPLGGRCLAAPAGQVGRGHGRARAPIQARARLLATMPAAFRRPRVGGGGRREQVARPMTGLLVSWADPCLRCDEAQAGAAARGCAKRQRGQDVPCHRGLCRPCASRPVARVPSFCASGQDVVRR